MVTGTYNPSYIRQKMGNGEDQKCETISKK
jgi:hypothetical protein